MATVVIAGGGLAGALAAWRLAHRGHAVTLVEGGARLGGNHTWSFHATDVEPAALAWLAPFIVARWPRQRVAFDGLARTLDAEYCSVSSERLHAVVTAALGDRVRLGAPVADVRTTGVVLADGMHLDGDVALDARGARQLDVPLGWQTFLGRELDCVAPHGVEIPVIMDATVPQSGAFRFVYVLPFSPTRLLVEDTAYADTPGIDEARSREAIIRYAAAQGWPAHQVVREETGSLPIPLGGDVATFWEGDVPRIGMRAGLFHPTTGYSLPDAVDTADRLAGMDLTSPERVYSRMRALAERRWRERGFFRLLNRWLFRAAAPEARARVLALFYRRPDDVIARFYGARLTAFDHIRLLAGRPPVPVTRALAHLWE